MSPAESGRIEKRIVIRAPQSRVWRAITDSAEFGRWFGVIVEGTFQAGQRVKMTSTNPGCAGTTFYVAIESVEPETRFSWRWHPGMPREDIDYSKEPTTLVEFRLEPGEGGTVVTVEESGFERISLARRAAVIKDNEGGWEYQAKQLEKYVGERP